MITLLLVCNLVASCALAYIAFQNAKKMSDLKKSVLETKKSFDNFVHPKIKATSAKKPEVEPVKSLDGTNGQHEKAVPVPRSEQEEKIEKVGREIGVKGIEFRRRQAASGRNVVL